MAHHESIKVFVQKTLGCGCPEEVFHHIDCQSCIPLQNCTIKNRINIGNRLLIYIIEISNTDSLKNILPVLVNTGKKERDSSGFNRLRLVLATDHVREMTRAADILFQDINRDEKIHLHIVHKDNIPDFADI